MSSKPGRLLIDDDDGRVAVVQDTAEYLSSIHTSKTRAARWVRGLSHEDEEMERATQLARERLAAAQNAPPSSRSEDRAACRWLRRPLMVGVAYLLVLFLMYRDATGFGEMMQLDFPDSEANTWGIVRGDGEGVVSFLVRVTPQLLLPSCVAALFSGWLCLTLGSAAHHFTALCGVGTAMLSVMAAVSQIGLLATSCAKSSISHRYECEVPFGLYWVCSVMRVGGPLLALWCAAPLMDMLRRSYHLKYMLALPLLAFATAVLISVKHEERATRMFQLTYELLMPVWLIFIGTCWFQTPISLEVEGVKPQVE